MIELLLALALALAVFVIIRALTLIFGPRRAQRKHQQRWEIARHLAEHGDLARQMGLPDPPGAYQWAIQTAEPDTLTLALIQEKDGEYRARRVGKMQTRPDISEEDRAKGLTDLVTQMLDGLPE